jgi:putative ABC transport system permease protein
VNTLRLALKMLRRDLAAGELRVLLIALVVAVASVATVGFFTDRVRSALNGEATRLLGGDLALIADHPIAQKFLAAATRNGLKTANVTTFPSMVSAGEGTALSEIKAVSSTYPLRGLLRIASARGADGSRSAADRDALGVPQPGSVWVADALLVKLGRQVGDAITLGNRQFTIAAVITKEPDSAFDYFKVAPRLLLNEADIASTGLIRTGSRVGYRLLLAGPPKPVEAFQMFAKANLGRGERLEGVRDARAEVRVALERAEQFLGLASLLSVILAAVGVFLVARRFMRREFDTCAILRCLGASQATLLSLYLLEFLVLGVLAGVVGCALGYGAQYALIKLLTGLIKAELPPAGWVPALQAFAVGLLVLLGFALPPLLRLRSVPPLRVLRRDLPIAEPSSAIAYLLGLSVIALLLLWKSGDMQVWLAVLGGVAACVVTSALLGWALISAAARLKSGTGVSIRYGLASLRRRAGSSITQIVALGLGIMALLLLTLVRGDLMNSWRNNLPADAPNRFVIGIQQDQVAELKKFFQTYGLGARGDAASRKQQPTARESAVPQSAEVELYPMIRGRLTTINGRPVVAESMSDERSRRLAEREFNLSQAIGLRSDNRIVAGAWWHAGDSEQLSVEEGIAKTLNLHLGDTLTFNVGGTMVTGKISNLRKVDWDSFKVNFFVIGSPGLFDNAPTSYITSFYLPREHEATINAMVQAFPNLSVIDVGAILDQVRSIADQVSRAVEFVFIFTLLAGLIVLYAAIVSSQDERMFEAAIMRTLGARRAQVRGTQAAEFVVIGLIAGVVAAIFASAVGFAVSVRILNLSYAFNPWVPLVGIVLGVVGVALAGFAATAQAVNRPPLETIRALG